MRRLAAARLFAPRYRRISLWWAGSRLLILLWTLNALPYFSRGSVIGDVYIYSGWADVMTHGSYPANDPQWQYPPAAALIMLAPKAIAHIGIGYVNSFFFVALAADTVVFLLLLGQADRIAAETRRTPHLSGAWAWVLGIFALGPIVLMRYDVIVTALAVGGMIATVKANSRRRADDAGTTDPADKRTWILRGFLLGLGAMVKVWPAVLLAGVPGGKRGLRTLVSAVGGALVVCGTLTAALPGALSFLDHQSSRGIEVESVFATPFMIASWFGYPIQTVHEDGNFQLAGPGTGITASSAILLTVLGFGIVLWWRVRRFDASRWTPGLMYDAGFAVLLVMVVTSRVLSPQYMIWLVGLAALCLAENGPGRRGTLMAVPARLVMACTLVSQLEFPILFLQILGHGFWGNAVVAVRNLVLLAATVLALRNIWSASTRRTAVPRDDADPEAADEPDAPAVLEPDALEPTGATLDGSPGDVPEPVSRTASRTFSTPARAVTGPVPTTASGGQSTGGSGA